MFERVEEPPTEEKSTALQKGSIFPRSGNNTGTIDPRGDAVSGKLDSASSCLPLVSFTKVICDFVVPKINVPATTFALGSLRCGRTTSFIIVVDSLCDVAVPVRLESLPSWMDVFIPIRPGVVVSATSVSARVPPKLSELKSESVHQRGDSLSLSEASNYCGENAFWTSELDGDIYDLSDDDEASEGVAEESGREEDSSNISSSRAESCLGAQKLRKWLASQAIKRSGSKSVRANDGSESADVEPGSETKSRSQGEIGDGDVDGNDTGDEDQELVRLSLEVAPDGSLDEDGEDIPSLLHNSKGMALNSTVSPVRGLFLFLFFTETAGSYVVSEQEQGVC
jgi:hypothetical protein